MTCNVADRDTRMACSHNSWLSVKVDSCFASGLCCQSDVTEWPCASHPDTAEPYPLDAILTAPVWSQRVNADRLTCAAVRARRPPQVHLLTREQARFVTRRWAELQVQRARALEGVVGRE